MKLEANGSCMVRTFKVWEPKKGNVVCKNKLSTKNGVEKDTAGSG